MKKIILLSCAAFAFLISNSLKAQSSEWTKSDRTEAYNNFMDLLTPYKILTNEQKESISLCALEDLTKKYSKSDYKAKIDIEIKRIEQSTINQCARNIGVDLEKTHAKSNSNESSGEKKEDFTPKDFSGIWNYEGGTYTFYPSTGEFNLKVPSRDNTAKGSYAIQGRKLVLTQKNGFLNDWGSGNFIILSVSKEKIEMTNNDGKSVILKKE
ncbi:MAG: hypothetical protein JSU07_04660 [Bacteroidetes bacterium]|nr:hypothetical protein [Bacteroidota bacterium]